MQICIGEQGHQLIIGSGNGLLPTLQQTQHFPFMKIHLKMLSAKCQPFCSPLTQCQTISWQISLCLNQC